MTNDAARAEFWKQVLLERCRFPAPDRLRAQFADARLHDFCACGCNTFSVSHTRGPSLGLANPGGGGLVFDAAFQLDRERTVEILLFCDDQGDLSSVEVDCCGNAFPVPDDLVLDGDPFHVHASDRLLAP